MYVKTKRLELKAIGPADLAALTELLTDEVVGRTYMVPLFADRAQAETLAERLDRQDAVTYRGKEHRCVYYAMSRSQ